MRLWCICFYYVAPQFCLCSSFPLCFPVPIALAAMSKRKSQHRIRTRPVLWALLEDCVLSELRQSRAHFIDHYLSGTINLSTIPRPECLEDSGFMPAPRVFGDPKATNIVKDVKMLPHWSAQKVFKDLIKLLRKAFVVSGVSISLMEPNKQIVKHETSFGLDNIPRSVSLDGHAILSSGSFVILDATKDWRTRNNPFVIGHPRIRFYCGVPLVFRETKIGVLAIFDPFSKANFDNRSVRELQKHASELAHFLSSPYNVSLTAIDPADELQEMQRKFGRATSRGSEMLVYEKDGSGNLYSQNQKLRFLRVDSAIKDEEAARILWRKLANAGSLRMAATVLAKGLLVTHKLDMVVVLELRTTEICEISSTYFPYQGKIDADSYRYKDMLVRKPGTRDVLTRTIGSHGCSQSTTFDSSMVEKAALSQVGLYYKNVRGHTVYNSGVIMAFHRQPSRLLKSPCDQTKEPINVQSRAGAYLIALFSQDLSYDYSPAVIDSAYTGAKLLRQIYIRG